MVLYCAQQLLGLKKKQKPFLHLCFSKASPFTLEIHMCVKAWRSNPFQIIRCLKNHEWLSYSIIWMFGWYSIVPNNFWGWKKKQKPFLHLSLSKASPFTLGNHICIKALKYKVFQIIRCLIKPLLKNSTQTIFQGGTPWVAQLLNNMNVWMVLYCAQQLLGLKKKQKPFLHLSLTKAGPFTLGNHFCIKALKYKVFQIIRCLIKPLLKKQHPNNFSRWYPMSGWVTQ